MITLVLEITRIRSMGMLQMGDHPRKSRLKTTNPWVCFKKTDRNIALRWFGKQVFVIEFEDGQLGFQRSPFPTIRLLSAPTLHRTQPSRTIRTTFTTSNFLYDIISHSSRTRRPRFVFSPSNQYSLLACRHRFTLSPGGNTILHVALSARCFLSRSTTRGYC
jgi:hypothetical protein